MAVNRFILFPRIRVRVSVLAVPICIIMLWLEGGAPFFIMLFSAIVHELGHIIAVRYFGYRVRRIDVLPMGAVISVPEGMPDRCELFISLSGPLFSLLCSLIGMTAFCFQKTPSTLFFVLINAVLGVFNLLPIEKLDGGKALCSYLFLHGVPSPRRICAVVSLCAKIVFVTFCFLAVILSDFNFGVALLFFALAVQIV